ncbi:MAG TPA: DUF4202 family protein [Thermoanaerobaculia bacterium]|nr:DUF4202 family protein [Thermoanaerobaculia bacterium]
MSVAAERASLPASNEPRAAGASPDPAHRYYPVFLDLRERLAVVVGGGWVAGEKAKGLLAAGARVRLVAPTLEPSLAALVVETGIEHRARDFEARDLDGASLVLAERLGPEAERLVFDAAEERRIFVNVQDRVPLCSFIAPAIVRRGDLQVAISTSGSAPALAVRLRERLERELGPEIAELLELARRSRAPLAEAVPGFEERRRRWYELVDSNVLELLREGERERAERLVAEVLGVEAGGRGGDRVSDRDRYSRAISAIDRLHEDDPEREPADGVERAAALGYAERMSAWIDRLSPRASEALRLAARCQHLRRWEIPRSGHPEGRAGYLAWRRAAQHHHAELAARVLVEAGYDAETIARVRELVQKKRLRTDAETQTLEDAACLVFLEQGLADFADRHPREKLVEVLGKTWRKMSPGGRSAALALELGDELSTLIGEALSERDPDDLGSDPKVGSPETTVTGT